MSKIENLEEKWQEKVLELKGMGWNNVAIAEYLNKEANQGTIFTSYDIFVFLSKNQERALKVLKEKGKFEKKMAERYFDTIEQLGNLNSEMWENFYQLKTNPEFKEKTFDCDKCGAHNKVNVQDNATMLKTADHILKQLQHVDAILGKLTKKSLQVNYNITEINSKVSDTLPVVIERMEKEGRFDAIQRLIKKKRKKLLEEAQADL